MFWTAIAAAAPAFAGETPLYRPAPAWIAPASLAAAAPDAPPILIFDTQQRIENGALWSYLDSATRIASPEMLAQAATLTIPWAPDKGDFIVHELSIQRGGDHIDLIAQGQKFTVLRREQTLEQRELTGILTATIAIPGLQVGDVLRLRMSITAKDGALAGRVQNVMGLIADPARIGFGRATFSWPVAAAPHWKLLAAGVRQKMSQAAGYATLTLTLPVGKQPEMPQDAPARFNHPPIVELSTFGGWSDVSKVMAPLYATESTIAPGSPLAAEVDAIVRAEPTPLGRAARALQLVQDKVRYLAVGMDGGNYLPQPPARTWELRYGDCKAKTLLLLAILRTMTIEAEPVLANVGLGDLVPDRLPSAAAFNHILVRATIGGETLWLDGTGGGSRLADIHDTPPFGHVLPVRAGGADLMTIATRANARPSVDLSVVADETAASDLPSVYDATAVVRGQAAAMMTLARAQLGAKEQRATVGQFFMNMLGQAQFESATMTADPVAGTVTLHARGVTSSPWFTEDRKRKRKLARALDTVDFTPDRGRAVWAAIPVAGEAPLGLRYRLSVKLPDGGRGYAIDGEPDLKAHIAGYDLSRTARLAGGVVTVDERIDATGGEIAAAGLPAERDVVATAKARAPVLVAPEGAPRVYQLGGHDPAGATQMRAAEAVFTKAIADDPDEASGYLSRASFRGGIGDRRGAVTDLTRAIALAPTVDLYLSRASHEFELGDLAASMADAETARGLDPSSSEAIGRVAYLKGERGDLAGAVALLDERIALGGDTRVTYQQAKADAIGRYGDPLAALKIYDALLADRPGSPSLLNAKCWIKGTRSVMLDTALKDCTSAIELSTDTIPALDSRALIWYRMGRYDDALRDLDVVIASAPGLAPSRFLRGVVLTRLHRDADAARDLMIARSLTPSVDKTYARYGIKP